MNNSKNGFVDSIKYVNSDFSLCSEFLFLHLLNDCSNIPEDVNCVLTVTTKKRYNFSLIVVLLTGELLVPMHVFFFRPHARAVMIMERCCERHWPAVPTLSVGGVIAYENPSSHRVLSKAILLLVLTGALRIRK